MRKNIILCGVGGQGIVLTSKLLAASAMAKGIPVMSAETIGMAQKGGSVFSFLRMGDDLCCPMFPKGTADLLIGFEPAEAVRMLPYLIFFILSRSTRPMCLRITPRFTTGAP